MRYPNWYGIAGIGFVFINEWADPMLIYKGMKFNSYDVEDTMWEKFKEDNSSNDINLFAIYMKSHADDVYRLLDELINAC